VEDGRQPRKQGLGPGDKGRADGILKAPSATQLEPRAELGRHGLI